MSYTPPAAWVEAMARATAEPVTRARITTVFGTVARSYHTGDGRRALGASDPLLVDTKHSARVLDVFKRSISLEAYTLRLVDAAREVTDFLASVSTIGKRVQIERGTTEMVSLADFAIMHEGLVVTDWREELGQVEIECEDPFSFNLDEERECWWHSGHPLAIIRDMLAAVMPAGVLGHTSLNELNYPLIGHIVIGRSPYNWKAFTGLNTVNFGKQRANGFDLLSEVLFLIRGTLRGGTHETDAEITFLDYDADRAVAYALTSDDIVDATLVESAANIINHINVEGHGYGSGISPTTQPESVRYPFFVRTDDASAAAHAWPDSASPEPRIYEAEKDETYSPWLNACVPFTNVPGGNAGFDNSAASFDVFLPLYFGFAGSSITDANGVRLSPPVSTIQTNHQVSGADGRYAYFLIASPNGYSEIVRAALFAYDTAQGIQTNVETPDGFFSYWRVGTYSAVTRGFGGTTPIDWASLLSTGVVPVYLFDITPAAYFGGTVLQRHANGLPIVDLKLAPRFYGVQEGDVLSFVDPEMKIPGYPNGVTDAVAWEVLSAEDHTMEDTPCIQTRVAFLRDGVVGPPDWEPEDFDDEIPKPPPVGEFYYDGTGEIYVDDLGNGYTNY